MVTGIYNVSYCESCLWPPIIHFGNSENLVLTPEDASEDQPIGCPEESAAQILDQLEHL